MAAPRRTPSAMLRSLYPATPGTVRPPLAKLSESTLTLGELPPFDVDPTLNIAASDTEVPAPGAGTDTVAPEQTQPSEGADARKPEALPAEGVAETPTTPPADTSTPVAPNQSLRAQAEAAKKVLSSIITSGFYTDPESRINSEGQITGQLVNIYTLTLYEHWNPDNPSDPTYERESVELPFVQRITMQAPNAVARTRSMSGAIYAEHATFAQRTFVLEGRSGPIWNVNAARAEGDATERLAITRFTNLRNFLEKYAKMSAKNKNALVRYKDTRLVLLCSFESEIHFCDVVNFNYRRSSDTSTFSFEYSMTLVTNGFMGRTMFPGALMGGRGVSEDSVTTEDQRRRAMERKTEADLLSAFREEQNTTIFSARRQVYRFYTRRQEQDVRFDRPKWYDDMSCTAIQDLRVAVSAINATLETSLFTSTLAGGVTAKQQRDTKAALSWASYGLDIAHRIKGGRRLSCPVPPWSDLFYDILPYATAGSAVVKYLIDEFGNKRGYKYSYTIDRSYPVRPAFIDTTNTGPEQPFAAVNYFLPENGADAYSIAYNVLGDINLYWQIINLNNFRDAYTRDDGTPLSPGSSVLIPSTTVPANKDNDVLGTDLLLVNGDLVLVGNNDVMRVSGYACYTQNLGHRMQTPRGGNRVFPSYGLMASLHTSASSTITGNIRMDVYDQVMQDPRTREVRHIRLTELGDKVHINMVVTPISGPARSFQFNYDLNSRVTA